MRFLQNASKCHGAMVSCQSCHPFHFATPCYTNPSRLMWHANAWRLCSEAAWDDGESSHGCSSAQGRVGCHCSEPKLPGMSSKHYDSNIGERRKRILQYVAICFRMFREHLWNSSKTVISQWLKIQETWVCMTLGHHRFWKCLYVTATLHKFLPSIAFQPIDVLLQPAIDSNPHQRLRSSKVCAALWFSFPHAEIYNNVDWWWLMWVFLTTYLQSCRMTSGTLYGSIWHYLSKPCKI